jgi:gentisate 1,2-dioxygenase
MDAAVSFHRQPEASEARREFYSRLATQNTKPLWEVLSSLITPFPKDRSEPSLWRYAAMRPLLAEAARVITAEEAERRVLVFENPGLPGSSQITQTLYAGLQLIAPGEIAPSHRHVATALRYVVEGEGAFTSVNGERTWMRPGDFILTPSWEWHDHGNPGSSDVIWLDGLDIPIANFFCTSFAQRLSRQAAPQQKQEGDSLHRFGMRLLPLEFKQEALSAPVFVYPFERSRQALKHLSQNGEMNPWHGVKLQYANPASGGSPMPTISAFLQALPDGFEGRGYRTTDATVYCVTSGSGRSFVGEMELNWTEHDVFVVPSWQTVRHETGEDSILFSFSDRVAQKALGLWREEYLDSPADN